MSKVKNVERKNIESVKNRVSTFAMYLKRLLTDDTTAANFIPIDRSGESGKIIALSSISSKSIFSEKSTIANRQLNINLTNPDILSRRPLLCSQFHMAHMLGTCFLD